MVFRSTEYDARIHSQEYGPFGRLRSCSTPKGRKSWCETRTKCYTKPWLARAANSIRDANNVCFNRV